MEENGKKHKKKEIVEARQRIVCTNCGVYYTSWITMLKSDLPTWKVVVSVMSACDRYGCGGDTSRKVETR